MTPRRPRSAVPLVLAAALAGCTGFHEVGNGVYRDRQPAEDEMALRIERYGIRTVVALRSETPDTAPSRRAAQALDVAFVSLPMSARHLPPADRLIGLWDTIATAERPILFHCRAGVDRTGLASALSVLHDTGDLDAARAQLALIPYGHVPLFGTEAMDEVLDLYADSGNGMPFRAWADTVYRTRATPPR